MSKDDIQYHDALFLGGPHDGEWHEVIVGAPSVLMRGPTNVRPQHDHEQNAWAYTRFDLMSNSGHRYPIYTYGRIDVVGRLLDGFVR